MSIFLGQLYWMAYAGAICGAITQEDLTEQPKVDTIQQTPTVIETAEGELGPFRGFF